MRVCFVVALLISGVSGDVDGCDTDPSGSQCHEKVGAGDVTSLLQHRNMQTATISLHRQEKAFEEGRKAGLSETIRERFYIGQKVRMKDHAGNGSVSGTSFKTDWLPGVITSVSPLKARPDGWAGKGMAWDHVEAVFHIGQRVTMKDHAGSGSVTGTSFKTDWLPGVITSVSPLKARPDGWPGKGMAWDQVEALDPAEKATQAILMNVREKEKAFEEGRKAGLITSSDEQEAAGAEELIHPGAEEAADAEGSVLMSVREKEKAFEEGRKAGLITSSHEQEAEEEAKKQAEEQAKTRTEKERRQTG